MGVYKRGKNYYIDFTFHGKRIKQMIGPSRKGAEKVIAKKKAEIAEDKFLDKRKELPPIKFHDFAKEYLDWGRTNNKPSSHRNKLYCLRVLDKEFGNRNLSEITAWQNEKWKKERKEMQSRRKKPIGPYEVNRELATLKHLFGKAVE